MHLCDCLGIIACFCMYVFTDGSVVMILVIDACWAEMLVRNTACDGMVLIV